MEIDIEEIAKTLNYNIQQRTKPLLVSNILRFNDSIDWLHKYTVEHRYDIIERAMELATNSISEKIKRYAAGRNIKLYPIIIKHRLIGDRDTLTFKVKLKYV